MTDECPACGSDLSYTSGNVVCSHRIGVNIPGVYDGTLFWRCPYCGHDWHRFDDARMRAKAQPHMNQPISTT